MAYLIERRMLCIAQIIWDITLIVTAQQYFLFPGCFQVLISTKRTIPPIKVDPDDVACNFFLSQSYKWSFNSSLVDKYYGINIYKTSPSLGNSRLDFSDEIAILSYFPHIDASPKQAIHDGSSHTREKHIGSSPLITLHRLLDSIKSSHPSKAHAHFCKNLGVASQLSTRYGSPHKIRPCRSAETSSSAPLDNKSRLFGAGSRDVKADADGNVKRSDGSRDPITSFANSAWSNEDSHRISASRIAGKGIMLIHAECVRLICDAVGSILFGNPGATGRTIENVGNRASKGSGSLPGAHDTAKAPRMVLMAKKPRSALKWMRWSN